MDLAREVLFAETGNDDGRTVSFGLSFEEAIRDALLEQVSLDPLGCFRRLPVSTGATCSMMASAHSIQPLSYTSPRRKPKKPNLPNLENRSQAPESSACHHI